MAVLVRRTFFAILLLFSYQSSAQELNLLAGAMHDSASKENSYAWALDYRHGISENLAFTLSWLNEGHVTRHHRDGQSAQLWARTNIFDRRLSLSAGAGPYRYYDTTGASSGPGFSNDHGWGGIFSVAATYYTRRGFLYELRANRILTAHSIDTTSLLFGVGYQLERPPTQGPYAHAPHQKEKTTENEVAILIGKSVINSFQSESNTAQAIEYRKGLSTHLEWTVGLLNEGDNRLVRRTGLSTQLWAVHEFFGDRLELGVGLGPYFAMGRRRTPIPGEGQNVHVSAMVSTTAAVRLNSQIFLRGTWNRVVTNYNRDVDVVLVGVGYRF